MVLKLRAVARSYHDMSSTENSGINLFPIRWSEGDTYRLYEMRFFEPEIQGSEGIEIDSKEIRLLDKYD